MDAVSGQPITSLDLGKNFLDHFGYPYIVMHRGDLMTVELEAAGETLSSRSKIIETQSGSRISATALGRMRRWLGL